MWQPQIARYPSEGLCVIAPDMRGHGNSSLPRTFALEDCARDMSELLQELEISRAAVAGVSMGGLIAQQLACDFPEQVDRLVIVDSFSGVDSAMERLNAWLAAFLLAVLPASLLTRLLTGTYRKMGKPSVAAYFERQLERMDPAMLRQARKAVNEFDIVERLGEIRAPTLVLVGGHFGKMALNMAHKSATAIRGSALKVLAGGSDPSNLLVPDAFDQEVLAFIKQDAAE
jgi:3-oxoadipate enol-lactonase